MRKVLSAIALFTAASAFGQSPVAPITVATYSKAALVGMQLSVKRAEGQGRVSAAVARCVSELREIVFAPVFEQLLPDNLTSEEVDAAENFARTSAGASYAKLGLLQIYLAVGVQAPEPLPELSSQEVAAVEAFRKTSAGRKLVEDKVLESPASRERLGLRIQHLLRTCRDSQARS